MYFKSQYFLQTSKSCSLGCGGDDHHIMKDNEFFDDSGNDYQSDNNGGSCNRSADYDDIGGKCKSTRMIMAAINMIIIRAPQQYAPHGKSPQVRVFASGDVVDY